MDAGSNFMTTHCDVINNTPYDIQAGDSIYSATEDETTTVHLVCVGEPLRIPYRVCLWTTTPTTTRFGVMSMMWKNSTLDSFDVGLDYTYCDVTLLYSRV